MTGAGNFDPSKLTSSSEFAQQLNEKLLKRTPEDNRPTSKGEFEPARARAAAKKVGEQLLRDQRKEAFENQVRGVISSDIQAVTPMLLQSGKQRDTLKLEAKGRLFRPNARVSVLPLATVKKQVGRSIVHHERDSPPSYSRAPSTVTIVGMDREGGLFTYSVEEKSYPRQYQDVQARPTTLDDLFAIPPAIEEAAWQDHAQSRIEWWREQLNGACDSRPIV